MSQHDVLALDANFENWRKERARGLTGIEPFLYYSVEHITKSYNLTDDEVRYGITDKANDGGIDAVYCLAGRANTLIRDDSASLPSHIDSIRVMVFQSKSSTSETGFKPEEIDKFGFFIDDLLHMTISPKKIAAKYTPHMLSIISAFKQTYLAAAQNFPSLQIEFYYVTRGDGITLNASAVAARDRVLKTITKHRGNQNTKDSVVFNPVDTPKLLKYVRSRRLRSRNLKWSQQPIPIDNGYVGMIRIPDYFAFLKNEAGELDELIFESNVRGSQGKTSVNKQMRAALDDGGPPDFWQLNNGITITCSSITPIDAYSLSIEDAQVVNGLQTSRQIYGHFSESKVKGEDKRLVLIKLIPVTDDAIRDKIIRATNNQNPIKASVLLLTGGIHRDIEDLFKRHGLYYDRRPGFYKDQDKPISQIVSLNEVAQAAISILLRRPDDARGRPGNYIGPIPGSATQEKHRLLFRPRKSSRALELSAYLKCVLIVRRVEDYLKAMKSVDYSDRRNLLFYLAYYATAKICKTPDPGSDEVFAVRSTDLSNELLQEAFGVVNEVYLQLSKKEENRDAVAKGTEMLAAIRKHLLQNGITSKTKNAAEPVSRKIKDILRAAEFVW
jgi:hypothetical protein